MATGSLPLPQVFAPRPDRSVEVLFRTPVPPFHLAFPAPGKAADEVSAALHRAANRVYHERRKLYGEWGLTMGAPALMDAVREDVVKRLLTLDWFVLGPIQVPHFKYLKGRSAWAWFPPARAAAEAKVLEMRKRFRKPKPRFDTQANNHVWGRPSEPPSLI